MITSQEIEILFFEIGMTRDGAAAARVAHNHEVAGSSPVPATKVKHPAQVGCFTLVMLAMDLVAEYVQSNHE